MRFRKRPVEIEAWQFTGQDWDDWPEPYVSDKRLVAVSEGGTPQVGSILIETLEGTMTAQKGDWIIVGIKGEIYPCKPDIFSATYEHVR